MEDSRILLISAHPDDEVIGAGIQMTRWDARHLTLVHITDGSPQDPKHAQAAGFATREEYASERRRELGKALELAGMAEARCVELGFVDQEAHLHLPELVEMLVELVAEICPQAIYTHPYEGGHPDHDAAAFAVTQAVSLSVASRKQPSVAIREFTSYHAGQQGLATNEFLTSESPHSKTIEVNTLTAAERALKLEMFQCFRSQEAVLRQFSILEERFRAAPQYDYRRPPHSGPLHYEGQGWNITGEDWRRHAGEALQMLNGRGLV